MQNAFKCTNIELLVSCKTHTYYLLEDKWYYHNYYYLSYFWVANVYISIVLKTKTQYLQQLANHNITIKRKLYLYNYFFCRLPIPTNILVYSLSGYPIHLHGMQYQNSFNKNNIGTLNLFILCIIYIVTSRLYKYSVMNISDSGDRHCETKDLSKFCAKYCKLWNKYISDIDISSNSSSF